MSYLSLLDSRHTQNAIKLLSSMRKLSLKSSPGEFTMWDAQVRNYFKLGRIYHAIEDDRDRDPHSHGLGLGLSGSSAQSVSDGMQAAESLELPSSGHLGISLHHATGDRESVAARTRSRVPEAASERQAEAKYRERDEESVGAGSANGSQTGGNGNTHLNVNVGRESGAAPSIAQYDPEELNQVAYSALISTLEADVFTHVSHLHEFGNARELFSVLMNKFKPITTISVFACLTQMICIRQEANESASTYFNRGLALTDTAKKTLHHGTIDKVLLSALINGLQPAYLREIRKDFLNSADSMTISQVLRILKNFEESGTMRNNHWRLVQGAGHRLPAVEQANAAVNFKGKRLPLPPCGICGKNGHPEIKCWSNPENPDNKLNTPGWQVSKPAVKLKPKRDEQKAAAAELADQDDQDEEISAVVDVVAGPDMAPANSVSTPAPVSGTKTVKLVLDSGSGIHTCNDRSLLTNLRKREKPLFVRVANNNIVKVNTIGDLRMGPFKKANGAKYSVTLRNVAYSKHFGLNLVSVSCLFDRGHQVIHTANKAWVLLSESNDRLLFKRNAAESIWTLVFSRKVNSDEAVAAAADESSNDESEIVELPDHGDPAVGDGNEQKAAAAGDLDDGSNQQLVERGIPIEF